MTNFVQVIKACEAANGAGTKKIIQEALGTIDAVGHRLIWEAMNPFRVFGVRKFDMPRDLGIMHVPRDPGFTGFFLLLDDLDAKRLTGNAARDAITAALAFHDEETAQYLTRILDKDLRAGFSADTVNKIKVIKDQYGVIPSFEVMLAEKMDDEQEFSDHIDFPCQADYKYDGERTIVMVKKDEILPFSRSGKQSNHILGLFDEDLYKIHQHLGYDYVLDCERISDLGFEATVNAKKSGNDDAKASLRLRAFFLMPLTDWMVQKCAITMEENRDFLKKMLKDVKAQKIILTEGRIVKDEVDMMNYCGEAINLPENKARKIEGLILKQLKGTYEWDRTYSWIKVKQFYPADGRIIGFYYGRPKSRLENTVGGAVFAGYTEDGTYFETCCGSGFNDPLRAHILANMKAYIGKTGVLKFQEISRTKSKKHAALRFPTLNREHAGGILGCMEGGIREDKIVELHDDAVLEFKGRRMFDLSAL